MPSDTVEDNGGAWQRTLAELRRLETALVENGWQVAAVPAGHVAPEPPDVGETERFGLVHIVPGDKADAFSEAIEGGTFGEYEVFRRRVGQRLYLLTKLAAPERHVAILLAGSVDCTQADALIEAAGARGVVYTHVQLLDGTHLGSFKHDDPSLFFPRLDEPQD